MRKLRQLKQGASYHVISRANRKEMIFNSDRIKKLFLTTIRQAKGKYSFELRNFCIMGNHYHFILKPMKNESLSRIMQWILSTFALRFNKMHGLTGHVWNDRFISKIIYSFYQYLSTFVYISKNPVRANLTNKAVEYEYSGISFIHRGLLDVLDRPPNKFLRRVWAQI